MRAMLIDPELRTLTEVQYDGKNGEVYRLLDCNSIGIAAYLNGSIDKGFDCVFASDDLIEDRGDSRHWFQIDAERDPPTSYPVAGPGLAVGTDDQGENADLKISLAELQSRVTFTRRKFRGFRTLSDDEARAAGADIALEVVAPIVDEGK